MPCAAAATGRPQASASSGATGNPSVTRRGARRRRRLPVRGRISARSVTYRRAQRRPGTGSAAIASANLRIVLARADQMQPQVEVLSGPSEGRATLRRARRAPCAARRSGRDKQRLRRCRAPQAPAREAARGSGAPEVEVDRVRDRGDPPGDRRHSPRLRALPRSPRAITRPAARDKRPAADPALERRVRRRRALERGEDRQAEPAPHADQRVEARVLVLLGQDRGALLGSQRGGGGPQGWPRSARGPAAAQRGAGAGDERRRRHRASGAAGGRAGSAAGRSWRRRSPD